MVYKIKVIKKESGEDNIYYFKNKDNASKFVGSHGVTDIDSYLTIKTFESKTYRIISEEIKFEDE